MAEQITADSVLRALGRVHDPEIRKPITDLGMIEDLTVTAGRVTLTLKLTIAGCPAAKQITAETEQAIRAIPGVTDADLTVSVMTPAERQAFAERVRGSKTREIPFTAKSLTRVICVTSGKGGVGKSSVTAGLAAALAARGRRVGVVDADVFGFSIPALFGLTKDGKTEWPTRVADMIIPPVAHGVSVISIGMFLGGEDPRTTAVSWRGPMLHRTVEQFLRDVYFGELDYLLLDLPPGTGDIAISVGQLLPHAEVIVVTTPQAAAADVAVRSALLAHQSGQRVIGVIENMSGDIFGSGGGQVAADRLTDAFNSAESVPVLGSLPLSAAFREAGDTGLAEAIAAAVADPQATEAAELDGPAAGESDPAAGESDPAIAELNRVAARIESLGRGLARRKLPLV